MFFRLHDFTGLFLAFFTPCSGFGTKLGSNPQLFLLLPGIWDALTSQLSQTLCAEGAHLGDPTTQISNPQTCGDSRFEIGLFGVVLNGECSQETREEGK